MTAALGRENDYGAYWMPFTSNHQFKQSPRIIAAAQGMYYTAPDGCKVMDGTAGLWCVTVGQAAPRITEAVQNQVAELDYAPAYPMGQPKASELATSWPCRLR